MLVQWKLVFKRHCLGVDIRRWVLRLGGQCVAYICEERGVYGQTVDSAFGVAVHGFEDDSM